MDEVAKGFRDSRLNLLDFFSKPLEQRAFASRVPCDAYAEEFYCWWFDDFYPESDLFRRSFQAEEIEALRSFSSVWAGRADAIGQLQRSVDDLLDDDGWRAIIEAARLARSRIMGGAA
jgi:hypothetical protein